MGTAHALYQYEELGSMEVGDVYTLTALENGTLYFNTEAEENEGAELFTTDGDIHARLTFNTNWDRFYDIDNGQYVWGEDPNSLYFYDGTQVINLNPNNMSMGTHADIDNGEVVWAMYDGTDTEVFLYSNGTVSQITDNDYTDDVPRISNGQIVWHGGAIYTDYNIYSWESGVTTQITVTGGIIGAQVEDGRIVWTAPGIGVDGEDDIFTYKDGVTLNISNSETRDKRPLLKDGKVAWMSRYYYFYEYRNVKEYFEIMVFDGTTTQSISGQDFDYNEPRISGDDVVFMGTDTEVYARNAFHYNGTSVAQLTDNNNYKGSLIVGDGQIAWTETNSSDNNKSIFIVTIGELDEFGLYTIVSKMSGKALDGAGTENGANVQQWALHGDENQMWRIQESENGVKIINVASGKALDGAGTVNGANVQQWDYLGGVNQQWNLSDLGDGAYSILNAMSGKALDVAEWASWDGGNIHQWDYVGGVNQQWEIVRVGSVPEFSFIWADEDLNNDGAWSYSHSQSPAEYNYLTANSWGNIVMTQEEAFTGVSSLKFDLDHNTASYADAFIPTSLSGTGVEPTDSDYERGKNISQAEYMKFNVKGVPGSEFTIALLMDDNRNSKAIELTQYLDGITDEWQEVAIPLSEFDTNLFDFRFIEKVWLRVIASHNIQHMTFYVDNIRFEK